VLRTQARANTLVPVRYDVQLNHPAAPRAGPWLADLHEHDVNTHDSLLSVAGGVHDDGYA
jgi:hypothetical protein